MVRRYGGVASVSAMLALLCARLPGPRPLNQNLDARRKFWCEQEEGDLVVRTNAADLSWLSEAVSGITMQKVSWSKTDSLCFADEAAPVTSKVEVKQPNASESRLKNLAVQVAQRLLSGRDCYAIVTLDRDATQPDGRYETIGDVIVQGWGNGVWEILGAE